jgi:long-chain acyl-CoA synthetase
LLHSAWTYEAASVDSVSILRADDLQYLWLPLSHVFGKVLLTLPLQIGFPTAIDGRVDKIVDNLAVVRPTFMGAAPRIFEKAHARIVALGHGEGGIKARIFDWAFDVGIKVVRARQAGDRPSAVLMAQYAVADRLVFRKIRERFGGRLRFFISGSAALNRDVAEWFDAAGILILEGYGMTESSAATFVNRPSEYLFGTVGHPLPGTEFRIAEDGEVLVKGPGVMAGYHNQDEATSEALDADNWLRTGDIGEVAPNGALRITDRKKDMFIVGGFNAYPAEIENLLLAHPDLAQVAVVGVPDERMGEVGVAFAVPTAGSSPDPDALVAWARDHMANYKAPRRIVLVDALPMNASNKVLKYQLREHL